MVHGHFVQEEMSRSFLKDCRFEVIHNGIDTEMFSPKEETGLREKLGIGGRNVILGVASIWNREKGLEDFARLDSMLYHGREAWTAGCRQYALDHFRKQERYEDYIRLYESLTDENTSVR